MRRFKCIVSGCKSDNTLGDIDFFCLPKKSALLDNWASTMHLSELLKDKPDSTLKHMRICTLHFENSSFQTPSRKKLNRGAIPTILHVTNGDETMPDVPEEKTNQEIIRNIADQNDFVTDCDTAEVAWNDLHIIDEQSSCAKLDRLFNAFFNIQQKDSANTVAKHAAKMILAWNEMQTELQKLNKSKLPEELLMNRLSESLRDEFLEMISVWDAMADEEKSVTKLVEFFTRHEQKSLERDEKELTEKSACLVKHGNRGKIERKNFNNNVTKQLKRKTTILKKLI